jgi:hypothetical protein
MPLFPALLAVARVFPARVPRSTPLARAAGSLLCSTSSPSPVLGFIDENGGGPGVRLSKRQPAKQPK